jgi:hypothetical protein
MTQGAADSRGRRAGAIAAGFIATALLSLGADGLMYWTGVFPRSGVAMSDRLFVLATAYRVVFTILGGYVTASLARSRPMWHVMILAVIGVLAAAAGVAASWNAGSALGPRWYPIALLVTAVPCVWLGGRLGTRGVRLG